MSNQRDELAALKLLRASLESVRLLTGAIVDDLKVAKDNYSDSVKQSARLEAALTKVKAERGGENVPDSQGR